MRKYPKPGVYIGNVYLGRLPLPLSEHGRRNAMIVGAVFQGDQPPRFMSDEEYDKPRAARG